MSILLFSYGTLQKDAVQIATFGRLLHGAADAMPGYRQDMLEITDPDVLRTSGERFHPVVRPSPEASDEVRGMVFSITAEELAAADRYEVSDYQRVEVTLSSGRQAWVYIQA
ncbi:gamma-glutamylcyclotransferase family protein [Novosphingobium terrae]|uniref:gamma-glutamylcyclotransferase family protein n=1 Tax=Novosphingobium terrae TaxID=2726189 RepID=UPI00198215E3|nr:gamma-glutamylcyclotransferase family protein [Novosphingobium terrae]